MVVVEDLAGFDRIDAVLGRHRPRNVENPVDVGPQHLVFRRCGRHPTQTIDLTHGQRVLRRRELGVIDALADLGEFVPLAFAELLLDGLELLAQVVLSM